MVRVYIHIVKLLSGLRDLKSEEKKFNMTYDPAVLPLKKKMRTLKIALELFQKMITGTFTQMMKYKIWMKKLLDKFYIRTLA